MYRFDRLNDRLLLITWLQTPPTPIANKFIAELKQLLNESPQPFFVISDLRKGRIIDVSALNHLGMLTRHPNLAGSTAFCENPVSNLFATTFSKFRTVDSGRNMIFDKLEDALGFLESLEEGLTRNVDWNAALGLALH